MKRSSKNRLRGKIREVKGKAKEKAGRMRGDAALEAEGLGVFAVCPVCCQR